MLGIVLDIDSPALDKTSNAHLFSLIHIFIEDLPMQACTLLDTLDTIGKNDRNPFPCEFRF